jgi:hypothetical protein
MLRRAGAPEAKTAIRVPPPLAENSVREAIARSLPALQRIGEPVHKLRECTSCHHNSLPALTVSMARTRGFEVDAAAARKEYESAIATARGLLNSDNLIGFGIPDGSPYALIGIAAESATPNASTDSLVHQLSTRQELSGRFQGFDYRPPMEYTAITFTATALRAMQLYTLPGRAAEFKDRIQRASRWLAAQTPRDTEEHALRLMGLSWAGAGKPALDQAAKTLIAPPAGRWRLGTDIDTLHRRLRHRPISLRTPSGRRPRQRCGLSARCQFPAEDATPEWQLVRHQPQPPGPTAD